MGCPRTIQHLSLAECALKTLATPMSVFADTIYQNKYAQKGEVWQDSGPASNSTPRRVVENVMGPWLPELVEEMITAICAPSIP